MECATGASQHSRDELHKQSTNRHFWRGFHESLVHEKHAGFPLLRASCIERLIPWKEAIQEAGDTAMIIPNVEAGYPGGFLSPLSSACCVLK
jgi:hypothetical protein